MAIKETRCHESGGKPRDYPGRVDNQPGPAHDIVALNAGAAIYAAGLAPNLDAGVKKAAEVIASGAARAKFDALTALSKNSSPDEPSAGHPAKNPYAQA